MLFFSVDTDVLNMDSVDSFYEFNLLREASCFNCQYRMSECRISIFQSKLLSSVVETYSNIKLY